MKKTTAAILFICCFSFSYATHAQEKPPILRLDLKNPNNLELSNFRTSDDAFQHADGEAPSRIGLSTLQASGSAQFSEEGLKQLKEKLKVKKFIDVDLRQESHGFLNNLPVSWYAEHDMANLGKFLPEIEADEAQRLANAIKVGNVIASIVKHVGIHDKETSFPITVKTSATEGELTKSAQVQYFRIPVTDHTKPTDFAIDRFVQFVRNLPQGTWLHFHCEAGDGRTTSFMVMYDMLRNGKKVSLEDIVKRQWLLGGINLFQNPSVDSWKYPYTKDRAEFLKYFYRYIRTGTNETWGNWVKKINKESL